MSNVVDSQYTTNKYSCFDDIYMHITLILFQKFVVILIIQISIIIQLKRVHKVYEFRCDVTLSELYRTDKTHNCDYFLFKCPENQFIKN